MLSPIETPGLTQSGLGEGTIDNYIIQPSVHMGVGILVLVAFAALTAYTLKLALKKEPFDSLALYLVIAAEVVLAVQVLLGIKLLDQGQGFNQLYIHYVGGLLPFGLFIPLTWFEYRDPKRKARAYAVAATVSLLIVLMAYFIGQSYANR